MTIVNMTTNERLDYLQHIIDVSELALDWGFGVSEQDYKEYEDAIKEHNNILRSQQNS